jgi:integrase
MAIIRRRRSNGKMAYGVQVYRGDGVHEWVGTRDTWREARELEREQAARRQVRGRETVAEFVARYLEDFNHGGERWGEDAERNLRYCFKRFTESFGSEKLARFPTHEALPWASRQPESVVRAVRALFNDAVRAELAPSNPFAGLGLERSRGRADIVALTEEELSVLAETALGTCGTFGPTMHALILFQGYVGCRPKETFNLRHRDVDYGAGTVYIAPSKNGKARTIILPPQAARSLKALPRVLGVDWLFTSPRGHKLTKTSVTYWWNKIRTAFEIQLDPRRKKELQDARPRGGSIQIYELRHAAATIMLERGIREKDVADQLVTHA